MHHLIHQLSRIDDDYPLERKILICPDLPFGNELLASLAVHRGSWIGWEAATVRSLARRMASGALARERRNVALSAVVSVLVDSAIDEVSRELHPLLSELATSTGMRTALTETVAELRDSGIDPGLLAQTPGKFNTSLALLLERYVHLLDEAKLADGAWVLKEALVRFDEEYRYVAGGALAYIAPGVAPSGLRADFLAKVMERGGIPLSGPQGTVTRSSPIGFLRADSPANELLAVLRDAGKRSARYDEIEIACTDHDLYAIELEALSVRSAIPATMLRGLPLFATRIGRAIARWFEWLESGLDPTVLVRALEAGDFIFVNSSITPGAATSADAPISQATSSPITPEAASASNTAMASALRRARPGWGRRAMAECIERLKRGQAVPREGTSDEAYAAEGRLVDFLERILAITPTVRDAAEGNDPITAVSTVAQSLIDALDLMGGGKDIRRTAAEPVRRELASVAARAHTRLPSSEAIEYLRSILATIRVQSQSGVSDEGKRALGGHLFLTDLAHSGTTGRRLRYIVGLNSGNRSSLVVSSPLLPDAVRERFPGRLRTSRDIREAKKTELHDAIVASDSTTILAYSGDTASDDSDSASQEYLDVWRSTHGEESATYDVMRAGLGEIQGAAPGEVEFPATVRGVWLQLFGSGKVPITHREVSALLSATHPHIARGLEAKETISGAEGPTEWHGFLTGAEHTDLTRNGAVSPSSFEAFGACPLRWFYRYRLGIPPSDVLEREPGMWLDAKERGNLLHEVFAEIIGERLHEWTPVAAATGSMTQSDTGIVDVSDDREALPDPDERAQEILRVVAAKWERKVPPPGAPALRAAMAGLSEDVRIFLDQERRGWRAEPWTPRASELAFGGSRDGAGRAPSQPVEFPLPDGGAVSLTGRIDRVDQVGDFLRIIDYKTGRPFKFDTRDPVNGGRRLQLPLYAYAASQLLQRPVTRAEYRFPTRLGEGSALELPMIDEERLSEVLALIAREISSGRFLPTYDKEDCRNCDYATICRVTRDPHGAINSRRAAWGREHREDSVYDAMNNLRQKRK